MPRSRRNQRKERFKKKLKKNEKERNEQSESSAEPKEATDSVEQPEPEPEPEPKPELKPEPTFNDHKNNVKVTEPIPMDGPSLIDSPEGFDLEKMLSQLLSDELHATKIFSPPTPAVKSMPQDQKPLEQKQVKKDQVVALNEAGVKSYLQRIPDCIGHFTRFKEPTIRRNELRYSEIHFDEKGVTEKFLQALVKDKITSERNRVRFVDYYQNWYVWLDGNEALKLAAHIILLGKVNAARPMILPYRNMSNNSLNLREQPAKGSLAAGNSMKKASSKLR